MTIYLAHPMTGLTSEEVFRYYDTVTERLKKHNLYSPVMAKDYLREHDKLAKTFPAPLSTAKAIYHRDSWMINESNAVLCDFTDAKEISIGCCMKLALANAWRKHVVCVMDENNIHYHPFVTECCDVIFGTLDEAIEYLLKMPNF